MLSAIATLVLMLTIVVFPLVIPIAVTVGNRVSKLRHREKPSHKPQFRIRHGFEQLASAR